MRYSIALPVDHVEFAEEFCTGEAVAEIAAAADRLGYHMVFATEHPMPERKWLESGGHHALDPFVTLGFAAAATRRLRLLTNLIVLSYRSPFVTAKAATTLDRLSAGRLTMGVGAGYLEAEFRALGVDFETRNQATDEALKAMKLSCRASCTLSPPPTAAPPKTVRSRFRSNGPTRPSGWAVTRRWRYDEPSSIARAGCRFPRHRKWRVVFARRRS
jgi:alkanesulfonate monooxygenase SsuD/methylene tetrahydromethanopterin reductase-like flavin-dependent oxidoreductase (luciferase family)